MLQQVIKTKRIQYQKCLNQIFLFLKFIQIIKKSILIKQRVYQIIKRQNLQNNKSAKYFLHQLSLEKFKAKSKQNMFSSYNQLANNLVFSERFYYNNYEYYNDYEKIQQKYKDDLSKVFFRINRKSKGTIFYQWDSQSNNTKDNQNKSNKMQVQSSSDIEQSKKQEGNYKQVKKQLGIQKLIKQVLQTFHQQNYSDLKTDDQTKKQLYQFVNLKYYKQLNPYQNNSNLPTLQDQQSPKYQLNNPQILNTILKQQYAKKQSYYGAIENLNSLVSQNDRTFLQIWYAFQNFQQFYLSHNLIKKRNVKNYKKQMNKLFNFVSKFRFILERTLSAQYYNSIFANLPDLRKLGRIFHPITLGLTYANKFFDQTKNGYKQKPKIVFLNLDGRETPYNLRYARNMGQNVMYISIFKQPSHNYKKNQKMQYQFDQIEDANFSSISDYYSRLLINQAYPQYQSFSGEEQKQIFKSKSKLLVFPLNSDYLKKQYYRNLDLSNKKNNPYHPHHSKTFPTLQTSADIFFLFQSIIFEQIRSFGPSFIIVSYNGYLNINEQHWNEIVKYLTIISDHRISLFMDFVDRLGSKGFAQQEEQQQQDQQEQEQEIQNENDSQSENQNQQQQINKQQEDEFKIRNIQVVKQFMNIYIPFKNFWPYLQHQRVLNNMNMFLKISSGTYSMQSRLLLVPHLKYSISDRYNYIECLGKSKELQNIMNRYSPKMIKSEELKQLYSNQGKIELKENRKQNQSYERLIDTVILQFLDQPNRKQRFANNYKLLYRLQEVLQEQQYQNALKYGGQEQNNPQYSATLSNNSLISPENRQLQIMHQYLKQMKKKLLLQNLQTYRHRKVFFYDQEADASQANINPNQRVKCYKFYLYEDDSQQISFQKYTQTIFDSKKSKVYIINYRATDERHLILHGNIVPTMYEKRFSIKVQIAKQSQRQIQKPIYSIFDNFNREESLLFTHNLNLESTNQQSMMPLTNQQHLLQLRKDLVFVNYSHCFVKNKLYLYWPQKWSIKQQIKHKLLGIKYKPENVNLIVRVQFNSENQCVYQTLQIKQNQKTYVNPRIGCSSYQILSQQDQFYIFGGIQDNQNDFFDIGEGIYHMQIKDNSGYFTVKALPKVRQKNIKQSSISVMSIIRKNMSYVTRLRPKMHYRIQKFVDSSSNTNNSTDQNKLVISGGYGRQFTNFFNMYSYQSYLFNLNTKLIQAKQIHPRRLIKLAKPIQINKVGKYYLITNNQNTQEVQQNFSDLPKDLFAYEYKVQKINTIANMNRQNSMSIQSSNTLGSSNLMAKYSQNKEINSFLDQRYRTLEFKLDSKKIYLFGYNRTIRQRIYTKFWSPQLYIVDGTQSNIVHISLKTQKNFTYNISNFLMPRQQDIVSLCLDQDRLYVLSSSPVIHSIQHSHSKYVLYQGNLSNMSDVVNKHQLQMYQKFQFKKQKQYMLKYKTLYTFDQKIYLFGGLASTQDPSIPTLTYEQSMEVQGNKNNINNKVSYRQDYILQKQKNKFVLKIRKVQSNKDSVEMISPVIVKFNQLLYFYSIQMTETTVKTQGPFPQIQENYKIKIQSFASESAAEGKCTSQLMKFYTYDPVNRNIVRIIPRLDEPKFVSISKHEPFNLSKLKQHLQKVLIRINKRIQQSELKQQTLQQLYKTFRQLFKQKNQQILMQELPLTDGLFKQLIDYIKPQVNQKQKNPQEQEMIKDLKICYSLINKLTLEKLIQRAQIEDSNKQETMSQTDSIISESSNSNFDSSMGTMANEMSRKQRLVQKLANLTLNAQDNMTSYRFIVQDNKNSRKIRYIAIGPLANVQQLRFFRIRFRHDVSLCLNKTNQDGFYYHPTINSCEQIDLNDRFAQYDLLSQMDAKNQGKSYKQYKLYSQLKI